jgi:hypothetical protein
MSPPPAEMLDELVRRGELTADQAARQARSRWPKTSVPKPIRAATPTTGPRWRMFPAMLALA